MIYKIVDLKNVWKERQLMAHRTHIKLSFDVLIAHIEMAVKKIEDIQFTIDEMETLKKEIDK